MKRAIVLGMLLALPQMVAAQQAERPPERTVNVQATATVEREPDRAVILLAVESTGQTARAAADANATRMDAVIAAIRRAGIPEDKIRTVSYNLIPQYAYPNRDNPNVEPRITGYRAINMVQVTIDEVRRVGAVIDAALQAGSNRVAGLNFELKDPESARREALRLAVARARADAEAVAMAAGQVLGPPLTINTSEWQPMPKYAPEMAMARADMAQAPPTPVQPGTVSVSAMVMITYRLESR